MFTIALYAVAITALVASLVADCGRTRQALTKAWKAFVGILPEFIVVIVAAGIILAFIEADVISRMIGKDSGFLGVLMAAVVGSITLMPGFVAFPLASVILQKGAGLMQIAACVSALMMVGVVTVPVERTVFGARRCRRRDDRLEYPGDASGDPPDFRAVGAAGPLYAAFPVATVLMREGSSFFNVMVFIGAWSTTKVPMFLFEYAALGSRRTFRPF